MIVLWQGITVNLALERNWTLSGKSIVFGGMAMLDFESFEQANDAMQLLFQSFGKLECLDIAKELAAINAKRQTDADHQAKLTETKRLIAEQCGPLVLSPTELENLEYALFERELSPADAVADLLMPFQAPKPDNKPAPHQIYLDKQLANVLEVAIAMGYSDQIDETTTKALATMLANAPLSHLKAIARVFGPRR